MEIVVKINFVDAMSTSVAYLWMWKMHVTVISQVSTRLCRLILITSWAVKFGHARKYTTYKTQLLVNLKADINL